MKHFSSAFQTKRFHINFSAVSDAKRSRFVSDDSDYCKLMLSYNINLIFKVFGLLKTNMHKSVNRA